LRGYEDVKLQKAWVQDHDFLGSRDVIAKISKSAFGPIFDFGGFFKC